MQLRIPSAAPLGVRVEPVAVERDPLLECDLAEAISATGMGDCGLCEVRVEGLLIRGASARVDTPRAAFGLPGRERARASSSTRANIAVPRIHAHTPPVCSRSIAAHEHHRRVRLPWSELLKMDHGSTIWNS